MRKIKKIDIVERLFISGGIFMLFLSIGTAFVGAVASPAPAEVSSIAVALQANLDARDQANKVVEARSIIQNWHAVTLQAQSQLAELTAPGSSFDTVDAEIRAVGQSGIDLIDLAVAAVENDADLLAFIEFRPGQGQ